MVYSPKTCSSWGWAWPKQGSDAHGWQGLKNVDHHPMPSQAYHMKLDWSGVAGTWLGTLTCDAGIGGDGLTHCSTMANPKPAPYCKLFWVLCLVSGSDGCPQTALFIGDRCWISACPQAHLTLSFLLIWGYKNLAFKFSSLAVIKCPALRFLAEPSHVHGINITGDITRRWDMLCNLTNGSTSQPKWKHYGTSSNWQELSQPCSTVKFCSLG